MSDAPAVVYLETDDEVTSVVRRIREADAPRVVVVTPGRSRATSGAVALRLLARAAEAADREVVVVGDSLTRSLAGEAGLAAFATLDDARRAEVAAAPAPAAAHAPIRIVRGSEETVARNSIGAAEEVTRPVRTVGLEAPLAAPRRRRPSRALAVAVALGASLIVAFTAGAALLPGATVTLVPATQQVGPLELVVAMPDPERLSGTAEATATATPTDRFDTLEPARGTVVFFNWTFVAVNVPAGTFVAAGEQAFATQTDVVVPRGRLTAEGRIAAGEMVAAVVAEAPGPAANVEATAVDTVLNDGVDARLRGFPENPERRVTNPDPTSGGLDEEGIQFSQEDVDAAIATLREELQAQVDAELVVGEDRIVVRADSEEPSIEGAEDLVGARDQPEATITGTLSWEAFSVDRAEVVEEATDRVLDDPDVAMAGHALLADSVAVELGEATVVDGEVRVEVTATALAVAEVDRGVVLERIAGRSSAEAEAALADLGRATVDLWPGWVASVPQAEWRIDVRVVSP